MTQLAFLDLVPICEGSTISQALHNAASVARTCEAAGYGRYWVAEHHGMPGIGGAATSVVLAHVGAHTRSIRIGSGGIMLPNHAPLQIAEQFGTLDALYPGRVDLAVGRAPGSDGRVAQAMRRTLQGGEDRFVHDLLETQAYFAGDPRPGFTAVPGAGANVQMWVLGSSTFGAQVAAGLGLPYGFASHFAPGLMDQAIEIYRENFRPSAVLAAPHVAIACNLFAADTEAEARLLASTMQQGFVALRTGAMPARMRPPVEGYLDSLPPHLQAMLAETLRITAIGTQAQVATQIRALIDRTGADEIILTSPIYDHDARLHSIALGAAAFAAATTPQAAPPLVDLTQ